MINKSFWNSKLIYFILAIVMLFSLSTIVWAQSGKQLPEIQDMYIKAGQIWQKLYPQSKDTTPLTQGAEKEIYNELIAHYTESINKYPNNSELALAYSHRGSAYFRTGQYEKALVDFDMVLQLIPSADNLKNRGLTYEKLGEYQKALNDYEEFLVIIKNASTERRVTERQDFAEKVKELRKRLNKGAEDEIDKGAEGEAEDISTYSGTDNFGGWVYGSWSGGVTAHNDTYNGQTAPNLPGFACGLWYPGHNIENAVWLDLPGSTYDRVPYYWNTWWGPMNGNDHYYAASQNWTPYPGHNYFIQIQNRDYCIGVHVDVAALYKIEGMYWD